MSHIKTGFSSVLVLINYNLPQLNTSSVSADLSVRVPAKPRSPAISPKEAQSQCT